jgi:hypothetical protein
MSPCENVHGATLRARCRAATEKQDYIYVARFSASPDMLEIVVRIGMRPNHVQDFCDVLLAVLGAAPRQNSVDEVHGSAPCQVSGRHDV